MNRQHVFNTVARHLLTQAEMCFGQNPNPTHPEDEGICLYYSQATGHRCAIGALIPDHLYRPEMENEALIALLDDYPALTRHLELEPRAQYQHRTLENTPDIQFLDDLRKVHDISTLQSWPVDLTVLAHRYGLNDDVVRELEHEFLDKITEEEVLD